MKLQISAMVAIMLFATMAAARASVEISSQPTANMTCTGGVCSPTAKSAVLNTTDLANMLAASDVKVVTGSGAVTITVSGPFSWTSTHRLTLDANLNVSFRAPVEVAGQGAVTIVTNDGGTGGDLIFFDGGKLDIWDTGSSLTVNGTEFTLVGDLATLASAVKADPSGGFALAKDYDAAPDGTYSLSPVETPIAGTVEGLGHSISNLTIKVTLAKKKEVGLFAEISGGNVRDLDLINANVTGSGDHKAVGTLVGYSTGTITGCSAAGAVFSDGFTSATGGLVGESGNIVRSHTSVVVRGGDGDSGGLVGYINGIGNVSDSYATGSVVDSAAGGLIGQVNNSGIIERSYATGQVTGRDFSAGGLIADNTGGQIVQSYASGDVTGGEWAGGLIGATAGSIVDSYALGHVTLTRGGSIGGLAGETDGSRVATSYSIGGVTKQAKEKKGGYIGYVLNTSLKAGFWDITTSGLDHGWGKCAHEKRLCEKIVGLTDDQLKAALPPGFDPAIWAQNPSINNGYPYLIGNVPPE